MNTEGLNITLQWRTGDDLDLHVTCESCKMERDIAMGAGRNNRKAVEHVFYADPEMLIGKEIGVCVLN